MNPADDITVVARAARAICRGYLSGGAETEQSLAEMVDRDWTRFGDAALSVLAAIRDPGRTIEDAALAASGLPHLARYDVRQIWQAMIDAAMIESQSAGPAADPVGAVDQG